MADVDHGQSAPMPEGPGAFVPNGHKENPRARAIAALHGFADWLAEHPEIPYPELINCTAILSSGTAGNLIPEADRAREIIRWGKANEARLWHRGDTLGATLPVMDRALHGVSINHAWCTVVTQRWLTGEEQ